MANRRDYYFRQAVTESELDDGFAQFENADHALITDQGLYGIFQGGAGSQHSPVADLTVDASGPFYGYDPDGQRIYFSGPKITINVAQDSQSVSTAVAGGGNEKWVSVAIKFARVLSDARIDGNSQPVFFQRNESYEIVVTQGAEAAVGTATRPSLDPDALLLFDVKRTFGQTQVLNADISITRRQDTYVFTGPPGGLDIRAGVPKDAVLAMLTNLNDHILGIAGAHPATGIDFTPAVGTWKDTSQLAATDVQNAIDEVVNTLGANTGATKIGAPAVSGSNFSLSAGELASQLATVANRIDGMSVVKFGVFLTTTPSDALAATTALGIVTHGGGSVQWKADLTGAKVGDILFVYAVETVRVIDQGDGTTVGNFKVSVLDGATTTDLVEAFQPFTPADRVNITYLDGNNLVGGVAGATAYANLWVCDAYTVANNGTISVRFRHAYNAGTAGGEVKSGLAGARIMAMLLRPNP